MPASDLQAAPPSIVTAREPRGEQAPSCLIAPTLRAALFALPPLDHANLAHQCVPCKVCGHPADPFDVVDLNKLASISDYYCFGFANIPVRYHRCEHCGFLFTCFFDDWTAKEFRQFIYNDDYAKIDPDYLQVRPRRMAEQVASMLGGCRDVRILDFGSGNGEFAVAMRARGFRWIESYDPFSCPARPDGIFDLITCFEVIEHTVSPTRTVEEMKSLLRADGAILFSQALQPADIERARCSWWYIAPRNGHVSTFTARTLAIIGSQTGLVYHHGEGFHWLCHPNSSWLNTRAFVRMGLPFVTARITADPALSSEGCWHSVEGPPRRRYRWTATAEITWPIRLPADSRCTLRVELPFINEVMPGFAKRCHIAFNGSEVPVHVEGHLLIAEAETDPTDTVLVTLLTPVPRSPAELHGARDKRMLGLAVAAE